MAIRIGLMGFGRIGRNIFRALHDCSDIEVGAISDTADPEALTYLLRYDTIFGPFPDEVRYKDGFLYTSGWEFPLIQGKAPGDVCWRDYAVDYVVQATGQSISRDESARHLAEGARRVILCAPPSDRADAVVVYGVNHETIRPEHVIVSNASCTAHCAAPVLHTLCNAFPVENAHFTVVHGYTNVQRLADVPSHELRNSRAAAENIVPGETNAASVISSVLPALSGRVHAAALRVPVANGSLVDMTIWFSADVTRDRINEVLRSGASGPLRGVMAYSEDPIVSSDIVANPHSAIVDSLATMEVGSRCAKIIAWFDNSWAYAQRAIDLTAHFAGQDLGGMPSDTKGGA